MATGKPHRQEDTMKFFLTGITLILLFLANAELSADRLYTWTDAKGNLHITEHPPPKAAKTKDVMTYKPQTQAQIQKIEEAKRREELQDETALKKVTRPQAQKTDAKSVKQDKSVQQNDDEWYIGREGKLIRRGEEGKEIRDQRQDTRREYRTIRRR